MANNGEIKTPKEIEKMKKALDKLKPHLMGESIDSMTIVIEGEKKKRDKHISKTTQPYGAKKGGATPEARAKGVAKSKWDRKLKGFRKDATKREMIKIMKQFSLKGLKPQKKQQIDLRHLKDGGVVDTTKFRYI